MMVVLLLSILSLENVGKLRKAKGLSGPRLGVSDLELVAIITISIIAIIIIIIISSSSSSSSRFDLASDLEIAAAAGQAARVAKAGRGVTRH